jgi:hypothetical protein
MGAVTRDLTALFARVTSGRDQKYRHWITPTYGERKAGAA